jgi:SAM-dependent methyltransferase
MPDEDAARFREFEHAGWERAASVWGQHWRGLTSAALPPLLDRLSPHPGSRLLDVACGTGDGVSAARERGAEAIGLDFSERMLDRARALLPVDRFAVADAEALPFAGDRFDAVLCNFGLLHFARPDAALREMVRVLHPEGRLAVTLWSEPDRMRLNGIVREAVDAVVCTPAAIPASPELLPEPATEPRSTADRLIAALSRVGLVEVGVDFLPLTHRIESAETLWEMAAGGTVRMAALLRAQSPETAAVIRREIDARLQAYREPDGHYQIPAEAVAAYGTKPHGRRSLPQAKG